MNRKGVWPVMVILAVALAIVGGIIGLTAGFKIIFSQTYLLYAIGIFIVVMTFIYAVKPAFQGNLTRSKRNGIIIFFLIGAAFVAVAASGVLQTAYGGYDYIQVPTIGYYECAPASSPVYSVYTDMPLGAASNVKCPASTDSCEIVISTSEPNPGIASTYRRIVYTLISQDGTVLKSDTAGTVFDLFNPKTVTISMSKGDSLFIGYDRKTILGTWEHTAGGRYRAIYKPFVLWDNPGLGGRTEYNTVAQGCTFTSAERADLLIKDTLGIGTGRPGSASLSVTTLEPYKTRNYLDVFVPVNVESRRIQTYNGQQAYCSSRTIYKIDEVSTLAATYKVVNYNNPIGSVACCNGDIEATRQCQNNAWVNLPAPGQPVTNSTTVECSAFRPCSGYQFAPYDGQTLIRYTCQSGRCVPETKTVECTTNAQCAGATPVCDTKTYTCVSAPMPTGVTNGDGQTVPATQASCDAKASAYPWLGYTLVQTNTQQCGFWCKFGLAKSTTSTTTQCKATFAPYYILVVIIIVFGTVLVLLLRKPRKRSKK